MGAAFVLAALVLLTTSEVGAMVLLRSLLFAAGVIEEQPSAQTQALVVLGGSTDRIRTGAVLHAKTGLPLLLTGKGTGDSGFAAESEKMAEILEREYAIRPRWIETASMGTQENARFSWCILNAEHIQRIAIVTDPRHLLRATLEFSAVGFQVTPVAAAGIPERIVELRAAGLMPGPSGMHLALPALKEWAALGAAVLRRAVRTQTNCTMAD